MSEANDLLARYKREDAAQQNDVGPAQPSISLMREDSAIPSDLSRQWQREDQLLNAFATAKKTSPDEYAALRTRAIAAGMTPEQVDLLPEEAERRSRYHEAVRLAQESPRTTKWMTLEENAKVGADNTQNFSMIETLWRSVKRGNSIFWRGQDAADQDIAVRGLNALDNGQPQNEPLRPRRNMTYDTGETRSQYVDLLAENVVDYERRTKALADLRASGAVEKFYAAEGWGDAFATLAKDPVEITSNIVLESLGIMAPGMPLMAGAGLVAGAPGLALAVGQTSYQAEYGGGIAEALQESGVDLKDVNAVREFVSSPEFAEAKRKAKIKGTVVGLFDAATAGMAGIKLRPSVLGNIAAQTGLQSAGGAAGEALGSLASGDEINPSAVIAEAIGEIPGGFTDVGMMAGRNMLLNMDKAERAARDAEFMEKMGELAAADKVLQRDPEAFADFIRTASEDGPITDVYLDGRALLQSGMAPAVAELSPTARAQYDTALVTGTPIRIPIDEYMAKIAPTDTGKALTDILRTEPEGFSRAEAREYMETQAEELTADVERAMGDAEKVEAFRAGRDEVKADIKAQLDKAARFTPQVNDAYSTLIASYTAARAQQLGMTPQEFYAKHGVGVRGDAIDGDRFDQSGNLVINTPQFQNWFGGSKVMGTDGKPLVVHHGTNESFDTFDTKRGAWFISGKQESSEYGDVRVDAYLSIRNPYVSSHRENTRLGPDRLIAKAKAGGFDGVFIPKDQGFADEMVYTEAEHDVWVALDPAQVKSAIGNNGQFDPNDPNILRQTAITDPEDSAVEPSDSADDTSVTVSQAPIPETVDEASSLKSSLAVAKSKTWNKGRDLKLAIQSAVHAAAGSAGVDISVASPQTTEYLIRVGVKDALDALAQNENAIGWYDLKTRQALSVMALIHPEIAKSEPAQLAFVWALAVTSNGLKVDKNFALAEKVYSEFKKSGVMPTNIGIGTAAGAINKSLALFNELRAMWGDADLRKFMLTNFKVGEIAAIEKSLTPGGEHTATVVRGSAILGPKIGNGFFSNLFGDFSALTMDRWLIRTWGRWTGSLIKPMPEHTAKARDRVGAVLGQILADTEETARLSDAIGFEIAEGVSVDELAVAVQEASVVPATREVMNKTGSGTELRKAGNSLAKYLDGQKEAPSGPHERNYIRSIFTSMLEKLRSEYNYPDLTMADLQAVLWYAEKRLYETAKLDVSLDEDADVDGYADGDAPDYANAAAGVARAAGVTDRRINSALKKEQQNGRATGTRPADGAGGQTGAEQQHAAQGFSKLQKRLFLGSRAVLRVRSNRHGDGKQSYSYEGKSRGDGSKAGLLKSLGVTWTSQWSAGRSLGTVFRANGITVPKFYELEAGNAANAKRFAEAITESKVKSGAVGAAVYVYPEEDYAGMRLFLAEDGKSGVAVKQDGDIVSVFSNSGAGRAVMELAIAAGGTKLDAFDTILPEFYSAHGFVATSRLTWDDSQAPEGWDKAAMKDFNNGEPDVVFMVYDPSFTGGYSRADGKRFVGDDAYDMAVKTQDRVRSKIHVGAYLQRDPGFFSALTRAFTDVKQKSQPGKAWDDWIRANAAKIGIKKDEIEWTGIYEYLELRAGDKVTREEIADYLNDNAVKVETVTLGGDKSWTVFNGMDGEYHEFPDESSARAYAEENGVSGASVYPSEYRKNGTKFHTHWDKQFTNGIPGTYREVLVTLPFAENEFAVVEDGEIVSPVFGTAAEASTWANANGVTEQGAVRRVKSGDGDVFTSSHWKDTPNVLVHLRIDEVMIGGKRMLRVGEIQSDWGQEGRKEGFINQKQKAAYEEAAIAVSDMRADLNGKYGHSNTSLYSLEDLDKLDDLIQKAFELESVGTVPSAPFVTDTKAWATLGVKQALRIAAESGVDGVVFGTGKQNADMYDLSQQVSSITATRLPNGKYTLSVDSIDGDPIFTGDVTEKEMADTIGKEMAEKIIKQKTAIKEYTDLDLKVGGEGMLKFYDEIIPSVVKSVIKPLGGTVTHIAAPNVPAAIAATNGESWGVTMRGEGYVTSERYATQTEAKAAASEYNQQHGAVAFDITPEMLEKAQAGLPLFQRKGQEVTRGAFLPDESLIVLLKDANLSTFLHESAHYFFENDVNIAASLIGKGQLTDGEQSLVDDVAKLLKWHGLQGDIKEQIRQWYSMSFDERRALHERTAESFEAYLFSGKAPNLELQQLFQRFRSWMVSVYQGLKEFLSINPEAGKLNDEVRDVFDRMIATDEQIALAKQARSMTALFDSPETSGMTPEAFAQYQKDHAATTDDAVEKLQSQSLRDLQWLLRARGREIKKLQGDAKELRNEAMIEARREVMSSPLYLAWEFLTRNVEDVEPGEGLQAGRLNFDIMIEMDTDFSVIQRLKDLRMTSADGMHPDVVAGMEQFGFSSGEEMMRALASAPKPAEVISQRAEEIMLERHGELATPEAIEAAADAALHNEMRTKVLSTEYNALAQATGGRRILMNAARELAFNIIASLKVRDVKPGQYTNAESKAGKLADKAMKAGDMATAAAEKRNQVLQNALATAAHRAREDVDAALRYLRKFERPSSTIDKAYQDQIDRMLERFDFKTRSLKAVDRRTSLSEWLKEQEEIGLVPDIPADIANEAFQTSYKNMTVEQVRGLVDSIKQIEHLGRLKNRLLTAKDKREFKAVVDELAATIAEYGGKEKPVKLEGRGRFEVWRESFFASHRKLSSLARQMDGGKDGGPVWSALIRTMNEASTRETVRIEKATVRLAELYKPVLAMKGGISKKTHIPAIGDSLTRGGRLAIALNWGNNTNRSRIMEGDGWTEQQVEAVLSTLTKDEWAFVKNVWEFLDEFWPDIAAKEERVSGRAPERVEPTPFTRTVDGETISLPGGYYPIRFDTDRSTKASKREFAEVAKDMLNGAFVRATTRRGHTKGRVEGVVKQPVSKTLDVITQHVQQVVHDLSWHEWLIDANRLLSAPAVEEAIKTHYGPEVLKAMTSALEGIAVGDSMARDATDTALLYLRANVSRATMGLSLTTAMLQPFGLFQSMARVGKVATLRGLGRWVGDAARFENSLTWIIEKSEFMRLRNKTFNRELHEIRGRVSHGHSTAREVYDASLFILMQKMQLVADVPTWIGAYEKAMGQGVDEDTAIQLADSAVLDSQGGGQTKDLSEVQRKHPFLTMFYSYFNATQNLVAESTAKTNFRNPIAVAGWLTDMALLIVLPAIGPSLIAAAMRGEECGELEECAEKLARDQAGYAMGMLIGVRELSGMAQGFDYAGPPVGRIAAEMKRFGTQVGQGETDEALVRSAAQLIGVAFGIPSTQIVRSWRGWEAWAEGDAPGTAILMGPPRNE